jgi:hypothetical protein
MQEELCSYFNPHISRPLRGTVLHQGMRVRLGRISDEKSSMERSMVLTGERVHLIFDVTKSHGRNGMSNGYIISSLALRPIAQRLRICSDPM